MCPHDRWTPADAADLYRVEAWGAGYFAVNEAGHLVVRPDTTDAMEIDLAAVVASLRADGLETPVLLRFPDLLEHRFDDMRRAFVEAIERNGFRGRYQPVYPIKVNQQRSAVESVLRAGARHGTGLEVGSKPELLAAMALTADSPGRLILCNGFKDHAYIELATLAAKLGRTILPIVEKPNDARLILEYAARHGIEPRLGVRIKLASQGAGRWRGSSGERSKFGLFVTEVLALVQELEGLGLERGLQLVHCHLGSQVHDLRRLTEAVGEIAQVYCELVRMGVGLRYIDVGGGLGVDYDGSRTNTSSSINYSLAEYASAVVHRIATVCDDKGIDHPTIVTESGRASAAYQSVLVMSVIEAHGPQRLDVKPSDVDMNESSPDEVVPVPLRDLALAYAEVEPRTVVECYRDAVKAREQALDLFNLGFLSLEDRGRVERLFWGTCRRVVEAMRSLDQPPEELEALDEMSSDTYVCNFSLFQSIPDSWAIGQLFPILPIHRLGEPPSRRAILGDLTCDSDGRIDRFASVRGVNGTLELHELIPGEDYDLAVCLVGAYQETLGAMHNLFGDTHTVHITTDEVGGWQVEEVVRGDRARDVLTHCAYDVDRLREGLSDDCDRAVGEGRLSSEEGRNLMDVFEAGLDGYTYLDCEQG